MLYGQSQPVSVSETKLQWKPIKQQSYMSKLNNFAVEHAGQHVHDSSCTTHTGHGHCCGSHTHHNKQINGRHNQMNTWSDKKKAFQSFNQLHTQFQNTLDSTDQSSPFKKLRNLSNEDNKLQRQVYSLYPGQQHQFSEFGQNQNTAQIQSGNGCLISLDKEQNFQNNQYQNISSAISMASTNENSNSDVDIIDDDYAKSGMAIPSMYHAKSQMTCNHQSTIDNSPHQHTNPLSKVHSSFSAMFTQNSDNFDDVSNFTGEATRASQKKKFVNREERFEFNQKIEKMKKTEMCRNILMYHHCKYGASCSYAHNIEELVPKQHLPSNYKTKMCQQYHEEGQCQYGQRCQFLHSIYDLRDKTNLSYKRGLAEEARLTWQRIQQGSDCIMVNILKGNGCTAPESRLPIFEQIYNKEDYKAELLKKDQEKQMKGYFNNTYDHRQSQSNIYFTNNKSHKSFQQYPSYQQRKSEPWNNKQFSNNSWEQRQYFDNSYGGQNQHHFRRINTRS